MASSDSVAEAKPKSATTFISFTSFTALAPATLRSFLSSNETSSMGRPRIPPAAFTLRK